MGVGGSNGAISGSIISKMVADGHLGMTALSRVTLVSAGLFCYQRGSITSYASAGISQLLAGFWKNGWLVGKSCLSVCLSVRAIISTSSQAMTGSPPNLHTMVPR